MHNSQHPVSLDIHALISDGVEHLELVKAPVLLITVLPLGSGEPSLLDEEHNRIGVAPRWSALSPGCLGSPLRSSHRTRLVEVSVLWASRPLGIHL